ncbi:MAG: hypothetical protein KC587_18110, partial [Nitrospira sp.]|nr:hypothetical protein [Nitrospira sp.]
MSEQIRHLVSVRSRLVDEVLDYLNSLIKQATDFPLSPPEKLNVFGGEPTVFESLWQERQLITDPSLYQKWIAEEKKRLHEAGQPIPSSINAGWNQNEISESSISSGLRIINWNEAAHEQFHHAIVVGGPGMGKSWLLR